MREIKFRAWNPDNKNHPMVLDALYRCDVRELLRGEGFYKNWVLMQYTGLKDKNGVEIYEGDILSHKFYARPVRVTFEEGAFKAEDVSLLSDSIEVIGNIYENPELLK